MVDAHVSGACGAIREGSSPSFDTIKTPLAGFFDYLISL